MPLHLKPAFLHRPQLTHERIQSPCSLVVGTVAQPTFTLPLSFGVWTGRGTKTHPPALGVLSYLPVLGLSWIRDSELDQPWLRLNQPWLLQGFGGEVLVSR